MGMNGVRPSTCTILDIPLSHNAHKTRAIYPPASAKFNEVEFAKWVQAVGMKLLYSGLDQVELTPVVVQTGELYLTVYCDEETGRKIKAALYN